MFKAKRAFAAAFTISIFAGLMCSSSVFAQNTLHYKQETSMKLHMMGAIGDMIGGNKPTVSEHYVDAYHMRTDEDKNSSSIFSIPEGAIINLDHRKKTYFHMGFNDMTAMFDATQQDVEREMDDAGVNPEDVQFNVEVRDLGESKEMLNAKADRKLVILEMDYDMESADNEGNMQQASGKFYAVSDVWVSTNVPGMEIMDTFGKNFAEKMGQSFSQNTGGGFAAMQQAFMSDSRMKPAMDKMAEEMKKLEGVSLMNTSYLVIVPEGMELDVDAVLNNKEQKSEKKKKARRGAFNQIAKNALRNRGLNVGRNRDQPQEEEPQVQEQTILTETKIVYLSIEMVEDRDDRFNAPGNYKEVESPLEAYKSSGNN